MKKSDRSLQACGFHLGLLQQSSQFGNLGILEEPDYPHCGLLKKSRKPGPWRCCRSPCWPPQVSPLHALSAGRTAVVSKLFNSSRSQRFKLDITCYDAMLGVPS